MRVLTFSLKKRRLVSATLSLFLLALISLDFMVAKASKGKDYSDPGERIKFIEDLGWKVEDENAESKEIVIPLQFSDVYNDYNQLQLSQGYDLRRHAGESATVYTYFLQSFSNTDERLMLHLMVSDGKIIGGDVSSAALDGAMIPLK